MSKKSKKETVATRAEETGAAEKTRMTKEYASSGSQRGGGSDGSRHHSCRSYRFVRGADDPGQSMSSLSGSDEGRIFYIGIALGIDGLLTIHGCEGREMSFASSTSGPLTASATYTREAVRGRLFNTLLWVQGGYYFLTGLWPLISIESFQRVTGPKTDNLPTGRETDHWLVLTVGTLILAIAVTLLFAALRKRKVAEVALLAVLSALGLTTIDIVYVARHVISVIYLLDAAAELGLIGFWLFVIAHIENEPGTTAPVISYSDSSAAGESRASPVPELHAVSDERPAVKQGT